MCPKPQPKHNQPRSPHLSVQQLPPQLRQAPRRLPALLWVQRQRLLAVHLVVLSLGGSPLPLRALCVGAGSPWSNYCGTRPALPLPAGSSSSISDLHPTTTYPIQQQSPPPKLSTHLLLALGGGQLLTRPLGLGVRLPLRRLRLRHPAPRLVQLPLALANLEQQGRAGKQGRAVDLQAANSTHHRQPAPTCWLTSRTRGGAAWQHCNPHGNHVERPPAG